MAETAAGGSPRLLRARVYAFVVLTRLLVRLPPRRLPRLLEPRRPRPRCDEGRVRAVVAAVDGLLARGGRLVPRGCLARGLALFYFLRRAGLDVSLAFGVGTADGVPTGHCWLVRDGRPYLERGDPTPLFERAWTIEPGGRGTSR